MTNCAIPTLELDMGGRGRSYELALGDDFLDGIGSSLEIFRLEYCILPSDLSHSLPRLRSCSIYESIISPSTALGILAGASTSLQELLIVDCKFTERGSTEPLIEVIAPQLRRLTIERNGVGRPSWSTSVYTIGLENIVDYISAPSLEVFRVRQGRTKQTEIRSIETWLTQFSAEHPASMLSLVLNQSDQSIVYGSNYHAHGCRPGKDSQHSLPSTLVDAIHITTPYLQ